MKHIRRSWYIIILILFVSISSYAMETVTFRINGLDGEILNNVNARLEVVQSAYANDKNLDPVERLYKNSAVQIRKALEPFGYFHSKVTSQLHKIKSAWEAVYDVQLGPPVIIANIDFQIHGSGKTNTELQKSIAEFPIKKNQIFNSNTYLTAKENLFQEASNEGFVKSSFENQVLINPKNNTAIIHIVLQTGKQYFFGPIIFNTTPYSESYLRRFVSIKPGQPFSSHALLKFQQEMGGSPSFQQVSASPDFTHVKDEHIPINVNVVAPKSQKYNVGIGYGTLTGLRLSGGVNLRRLTETGHHFDGQVRFSKVVSGFAAKYYIPGKNPLIDQWTFGSNLQSFTPKNASSHGMTVYGGYETKYFNIKNTFNLNYLWERYRIYDSAKVTSKMLYPNINWSYTSADNLITPHNGKSLSLTLQGAIQQFISSTTFGKAEIQGKYIISPFSFSRIILKGDIGYMRARNIENLPASLRFYTGGLSGVRGYNESSIGPGTYLSVGSLEYQNKIRGNFYGGVFYDMGNASDQFNTNYFRGAGVGLIYDSMLGPLKIYVARALDNPKKKISVEFSIGPEF